MAGNPGVRPLDWATRNPAETADRFANCSRHFSPFCCSPPKKSIGASSHPFIRMFPCCVCVCGVSGGGGVIECRRLFSTARLARHTSTIAVYVVLRVKRNCVYCENPRAPSSEETLSASNRIIVNFRNTRALAVPCYCPVMRPCRQPSVDQTEAETGVNKMEHLHLNRVARILLSIIGPRHRLSGSVNTRAVP